MEKVLTRATGEFHAWAEINREPCLGLPSSIWKPIIAGVIAVPAICMKNDVHSAFQDPFPLWLW